MKTLPIFLSHLLINGIYGIIAGVAWSFAIKKPLLIGFEYGLSVGLVFGFFMFLANRSMTARKRLNDKEATFVSGSWSGTLLILVLVAALITWIVKLFI